MKIGTFIAAAFIGLAVISCNTHEIIPAPEQKVDLKFHFQGYMRGSFIEFTQNVDGFDLEANKIKTIIPNTFSRATYYSYIKSAQKSIGVKLLVGEALWDGDDSNDPDVNVFTDLFKNFTEPGFSPEGKSISLFGMNTSGFDVHYKDANGNIWKGMPGGSNNLEFTYLNQETDKTGDYMKYIAKMNVTLERNWWEYEYDPLGIVIDSIPMHDEFQITDGVMKGWFKR